MNIQRGDVLKARFPRASGERGKKRPVVVVQADIYNQRLRHAVVAEVTGNLGKVIRPAFSWIVSARKSRRGGLTGGCLRDGRGVRNGNDSRNPLEKGS